MTEFRVETLKAYLGKDARTEDDGFLELVLRGAVGQCHRYTKRRLSPIPVPTEAEPDPAAITFAVPTGGQRLVRIPDARELTSVRADGTPASGWTLHGADAGEPQPFIHLPFTAVQLELTGHFGFLDLPDEVEDAIYVQAARNFQERKAGYSDTIEIGADGGARSYFRQLLPRVKATYDDFKPPEITAVSVSMTTDQAVI